MKIRLETKQILIKIRLSSYKEFHFSIILFRLEYVPSWMQEWSTKCIGFPYFILLFQSVIS